MNKTTVMVQGTTSDAGKSVLVTGLCRVLTRRMLSVAPFKPQNMALNSAVTVDGGEIGRAQAVQAQACLLEAHTDMNPILLKPNTDIGAQVIVQGKVKSNLDAKAYHYFKTQAMDAVLDSYQRLQTKYHYIVVEGAGSPAEINLRDRDIANMGFAEAVDCPVILIADIDRGGVFAHLVGTLELLSRSERERIIGFVINRFRGDIVLLQSGLDWLEERTNKPVLGVLPYLQGFHLEAEDAITDRSVAATHDNHIKIIVPVLSRISNHTDFDPLRLHPQVEFHFIGPGETIPGADLIILPGSKNVRTDMQWLDDHGWISAINKHLRYGGKLLGICGGYQMLGTVIDDPDGIEGKPGCCQGLNLLSMQTVLKSQKQLHRVSGRLIQSGALVAGYEIHAGITTGEALKRPAILLDEKAEGALSFDDQIMGTYLHGLFDETDSCVALLKWAGLNHVEAINYSELKEKEIERLADSIEENLDMAYILKFFDQEIG